MSNYYPIIFDLETKYSLREKSVENLEVSVLGYYDYSTGKAEVLKENELRKFFYLAERASYLIGFNIKGFDLKVLQAYYTGNIFDLPSFDLMEDIKIRIGKRISLNSLISATLGKKKISDGLEAINMYREGRFDDLNRYCLSDVLLTRDLFEFGVKNKKVYYQDFMDKIEVQVDWKKYLQEKSETNLNLTLF